MTDLPLFRIPCEGSDLPPRGGAKMNAGICQVCGVIVTCRDSAADMEMMGRPVTEWALAETTWPHERNDIPRMLLILESS